MDTRERLEARKRSLLSGLERALLDALAESPEVHRSIWRLQRAGYTLHFAISCEESTPGAEEAPREARPSGTFRIDAGDLSFLRSIGIDPTRRARPRRRA